MNKDLKARLYKVPYDIDGNTGNTIKVFLETPYGLMKFKVQATTNEKLILETLAEELKEEENTLDQ